MGKEKLTIGRAAKEAHVNVQTLRYYERKNLLKPTAREASGFRIYDYEAVTRLRFIKHAQSLGFSLKDIKELLNLQLDRKSQCEKTMARASKKLAEIEEKIAHLNAIRQALKGLLNKCRNKETSDECPMLKAFAEEGAI